MAGYTVLFDEKDKLAIGLVGAIWAVGPDHFEEFHDLVEKRVATNVPGNSQIIRYDDPDWQSLVDWLRENGTGITTLDSLGKNHHVLDQDPSHLIKYLGGNVIGVIDNDRTS